MVGKLKTHAFNLGEDLCQAVFHKYIVDVFPSNSALLVSTEGDTVFSPFGPLVMMRHCYSVIDWKWS